MLQPHQVFAGRYRIIRHIADGGMGAVFEAEHVGTEARVALKLLLPHVVQMASARRRFELEAKIAARVDSEHIVKVFDAGLDEASRSPFLVMELLAGQTLAAHIRRSGPLPAAEVLSLMRQLASGLDAAHGYRTSDGSRQPIVHRDLKPENLFLATRPDGTSKLKILDFGIAKVLSASTEVSQEMRGTPLYMAFEQAAGEALSPQTDIWAFGLITFFALTGQRYWPAANKPTGSPQALFAEILTLALPLPSQRLRDAGSTIQLPPAFDAWLLRCIDRRPARRFASAGRALEELEAALAPSEAAPAPARQAPRRTPPRSRATATFERPVASPRAQPSLADHPSLVSVAAVASVSERRSRSRRSLSERLLWLSLAAAGLSLCVLAGAWRVSRERSREAANATENAVSSVAPNELDPPAAARTLEAAPAADRGGDVRVYALDPAPSDSRGAGGAGGAGGATARETPRSFSAQAEAAGGASACVGAIDTDTGRCASVQK